MQPTSNSFGKLVVPVAPAVTAVEVPLAECHKSGVNPRVTEYSETTKQNGSAVAMVVKVTTRVEEAGTWNTKFDPTSAPVALETDERLYGE